MTPPNAGPLRVPDTADGERVDKWVGHALGLSRARVKELFEAGRVRVNGRRARKGETLAGGQEVSVELDETPADALVPEADAPLVVLYEDEALVAVDKPAARPSHPLKPGEKGTVANALVARFPECRTAADDEREGGLCHRLDVDTSGVLLAARTREAWRKVREAFTARAVDKRYWALVSGPLFDQGEIEVPLRHAKSDRVEPATGSDADAREALSKFWVLARAGEYSLVEVQILTGVLHQVRAHLAAIGAPIVGDTLYGGRADPELSRFFLHARALSLEHPSGRGRVAVQSPLPEELTRKAVTLGFSLGAGLAYLQH